MSVLALLPQRGLVGPLPRQWLRRRLVNPSAVPVTRSFKALMLGVATAACCFTPRFRLAQAEPRIRCGESGHAKIFLCPQVAYRLSPAQQRESPAATGLNHVP